MIDIDEARRTIEEAIGWSVCCSDHWDHHADDCPNGGGDRRSRAQVFLADTLDELAALRAALPTDEEMEAIGALIDHAPDVRKCLEVSKEAFTLLRGAALTMGLDDHEGVSRLSDHIARLESETTAARATLSAIRERAEKARGS